MDDETDLTEDELAEMWDEAEPGEVVKVGPTPTFTITKGAEIVLMTSSGWSSKELQAGLTVGDDELGC